MLRLNRRPSLLFVTTSSFALASLGVIAWACNSKPQVEAGISIERAFPRLRFERPVFLTGANDGTDRIFVVEQAGIIRVFENGEDPESSEVFLDLSANTSRSGNEEGLLGLAFHPEFSENGSFFVHYSLSNPDKVGRVSRFQVSKDNPSRCYPSTEEVLLSQAQPWRNHNGAQAFRRLWTSSSVSIVLSGTGTLRNRSFTRCLSVRRVMVCSSRSTLREVRASASLIRQPV